jgi:hypothetical protein
VTAKKRWFAGGIQVLTAYAALRLKQIFRLQYVSAGFTLIAPCTFSTSGAYSLYEAVGQELSAFFTICLWQVLS